MINEPDILIEKIAYDGHSSYGISPFSYSIYVSSEFKIFRNSDFDVSLARKWAKFNQRTNVIRPNFITFALVRGDKNYMVHSITLEKQVRGQFGRVTDFGKRGDITIEVSSGLSFGRFPQKILIKPDASKIIIFAADGNCRINYIDGKEYQPGDYITEIKRLNYAD